MSANETNEYWVNRNADSFDKNAYASGRIKALEKMAELAEYRLNLPHMKSVELGCGTGLFSKISGIRNIIGIDFSQTLLDVASLRMDQVFRESIFELTLQKDSFDNIISIFVLDDYPSDRKKIFFSEVFSILKKNGHFFFAAYTENDEGIKKFQDILGYKTYVEPESEYRMLLSDAGFHIESLETMNADGVFNFEGTSQQIKREYILIDAIKTQSHINHQLRT